VVHLCSEPQIVQRRACGAAIQRTSSRSSRARRPASRLLGNCTAATGLRRSTRSSRFALTAWSIHRLLHVSPPERAIVGIRRAAVHSCHLCSSACGPPNHQGGTSDQADYRFARACPNHTPIDRVCAKTSVSPAWRILHSQYPLSRGHWRSAIISALSCAAYARSASALISASICRMIRRAPGPIIRQ
jgi:hypothetical protein